MPTRHDCPKPYATSPPPARPQSASVGQFRQGRPVTQCAITRTTQPKRLARTAHPKSKAAYATRGAATRSFWCLKRLCSQLRCLQTQPRARKQITTPCLVVRLLRLRGKPSAYNTHGRDTKKRASQCPEQFSTVSFPLTTIFPLFRTTHVLSMCSVVVPSISHELSCFAAKL